METLPFAFAESMVLRNTGVLVVGLEPRRETPHVPPPATTQ